MNSRMVYVIHRIEKIGPTEKEYNIFTKGSHVEKLSTVLPVAFRTGFGAFEWAKERMIEEKQRLYENAVIAEWNDKLPFLYYIYRTGTTLHMINFEIVELYLGEAD